MKKFILESRKLLVLLLLIVSVSLFGQNKIASPPDSCIGNIGTVSISIKYNSPYVKGRKIWGDLVPYNKVWRAGANEATVFKVNQDVHIEGKLLAAGKYSFFLIPGEKTWTVIFNKVFDQWGAYDYKKKEDALRVEVKPKTSSFQERLVYKIKSDGVSLIWENIEIPISIK